MSDSAISLTIPYCYKAAYIPKGCRKERMVRLKSSTVITVPVLKADNAPIAFDWQESSRRRGCDIDETVTQYRRLYESRLWKPYCKKHLWSRS